MLADLDFEHPVLAPFARAKVRDFTKIRFWKHRSLTLPENPGDSVSVIARFDSGDPAWLEKRVGDGSVVVFLSGWEPRESQLALSSKFVPVLYSLFENAGYSSRSAPTNYAGRTSFTNTDDKETPATKPGFYETKKDGRTETLAVNLYPTEGNVDSFDRIWCCPISEFL